jgi:gas vesicle protein
VEDRARILTSACLGALIGGAVGYLFLTEDGRRLRERLGPGLGDLLQDFQRLNTAAERARVAAVESVRTLQGIRHGIFSGGWDERPPAGY